MQIIVKSISELVSDPANARKHSQKNIDAIKGSLARFGQQKPIVIGQNGVVIAGNGTLEAAKALGWSEINCVVTNLTGSDLTGYGIADNRSSELAEWDTDVLGKLLQGLKDDGFDLDSIGFDTDDLADFIIPEQTEGLTDPDDVPEVAQNIHNVKRGQLWKLGEHRLLCGDSTNKDDVERLMDGQKADMVFTDPPYGISLNGDVKSVFSREKNARKWKPIENDDQFFDIHPILSLFEYCKEIFIFGANFLGLVGNYVVWDKVCQKYDGRPCVSDFELCWSKQKHQQKIIYMEWVGWSGKRESDGDRIHPTQKPVALPIWFFDRWGKSSQLIVDLFLGSGSTLIACEKTGRKCYGMEIDPHYCSVIIERWQQFTGKKAELVE